MSPEQASVVSVADVIAVPWRNGGGITRQLLAWPDPEDWALRISVADISASGPFSRFPGVDRWFAVLSGGAVRLDTAGADPTELTAERETLHAFAGDIETHCTMQGAATRDFNLMVQRRHARCRQQPLGHAPEFATRAEGAGLFVTAPVMLELKPAQTLSVPAMSLVWWPNPQRESRLLRVRASQVRGWWFEIDTDLQRIC